MTTPLEDVAGITVPARLRAWRRREWTLFWDPATLRSLKVNESGRFILDGLRHGHSVAHLAELASGEFGVARAEAEDGIRAFLAGVVDSGFLSRDAPPPLATVDEVGDGFPRFVYLHLTDSCNLRCTYCYNRDQRDASRARQERGVGRPRLTTEEYERLIDRILELGALNLVFTGGEPLLRADALRLVEHARARRADVGIAFLTNATLVTDEIAERLCASATLVKVSLDGHDARTHEIHRGDGTFALTVRGIERLVAAKRRVGSSVAIAAVPVVSSDNVGDARAVADLALNRLGVDAVEGILFQAQSAAPSARRLIPRLDAWAAAAQDLREVSAARAGAERAVERDAPSGVPMRDHCGAGWGEISVSPTGLVYPCQRFHDDDLVAGDVRREDIADVYRCSPVLIRMRSLKVDTIPVCRDCVVRYVCGGGCRALAFHVEGSLEAHNAVYCAYLEQMAVDALWASCDRDAGGVVQVCP